MIMKWSCLTDYQIFYEKHTTFFLSTPSHLNPIFAPGFGSVSAADIDWESLSDTWLNLFEEEFEVVLHKDDICKKKLN